MHKRFMKNQIALLLYKLVLLFAKCSPAKRSVNSVLLIKNDEIGDYILFRNFLKDIRSSEKYKNHKITLLGNIIWKQLFDEFDSAHVNDVIWMEKKKFQKEIFYRFSFLRTIRKRGFSEVVNCIYSRNMLNDECFVSVANCDIKIGMKQARDKVTDSLYTGLIRVGDNIQFDIFRNQDFIGSLIGKPEKALHNSVFFEPLVQKKITDKKYCVIFAGAGKQDKLWPARYFAEIITYIHSKYDLDLYLCGGPGDVKDLIEIQVNDITGKTTMPQSLNVLASAEFMLSVDTGSVHMGSGVKCPVIALYSGRDYGRFAPYPKDVFDKFYSVFSDKVDKVVNENISVLYNPDLFPFSEIKNIPPSKVVPYVDLLLSK